MHFMVITNLMIFKLPNYDCTNHQLFDVQTLLNNCKIMSELFLIVLYWNKGCIVTAKTKKEKNIYLPSRQDLKHIFYWIAYHKDKIPIKEIYWSWKGFSDDFHNFCPSNVDLFWTVSHIGMYKPTSKNSCVTT